jgi:hypothetical protein
MKTHIHEAVTMVSTRKLMTIEPRVIKRTKDVAIKFV